MLDILKLNIEFVTLLTCVIIALSGIFLSYKIFKNRNKFLALLILAAHFTVLFCIITTLSSGLSLAELVKSMNIA